MKPGSPLGEFLAAPGSRGFPLSPEAVSWYPKAASHCHCCYRFMLKFLFWDHIIWVCHPLPLSHCCHAQSSFTENFGVMFTVPFSLSALLCISIMTLMSQKPRLKLSWILLFHSVFSNLCSKTHPETYHLEFHYFTFEILKLSCCSLWPSYLSSLQFFLIPHVFFLIIISPFSWSNVAFRDWFPPPSMSSFYFSPENVQF